MFAHLAFDRYALVEPIDDLGRGQVDRVVVVRSVEDLEAVRSEIARQVSEIRNQLQELELKHTGLIAALAPQPSI